MSQETLQNWLLENNAFIGQVESLTIDSVTSQFPNIQKSLNNNQHDWEYLLFCGSILASSSMEKCQDIALRIAQTSLHMTTDQTIRDASQIILDTLGNPLALNLAIRRNIATPNISDRLPIGLSMDWIRRSYENSIILSSEPGRLKVNKFQKKFWEIVDNYNWISVSAPTSAGKSYVLLQWLKEQLRNKGKIAVVYIVPTRALIQQVEQDLRKVFESELKVGEITISTLPVNRDIDKSISNIFVFTQERLQIFLNYFPQYVLDFMIIDEAHKIGDGIRGVLLQQVLDIVSAANLQAKIIFACPLARNPEILLSQAGINVSSKFLLNEDIMINQNLIWVSQIPRLNKLWNVELCFGNEPKQIGTVELRFPPNVTSKRLPLLAEALGSEEGGNLIYISEPAEAEMVALQLYDLFEELPERCSELENLIDLVKKTIHSKYRLAKVLEKGIAFHYGNLPLLIRTEIEKLFKNNIIKFMVCTSTLIEGVNLPCKNIFIRGPQKGRGKPMTPVDFWNLAGRAGRWGHEFQGNIICVDVYRRDVWKDGAPKKREYYNIVPTTNDIILNQRNDLVKYFEESTSKIENGTYIESVFSYLVSAQKQFGTLLNSSLVKYTDKDFLLYLEEKTKEIWQNLKTPPDIVLRNPGINPIAMDRLLDYFANRKKPLEELIPAQVHDDDAVVVWTRILMRINKHLSIRFKGSRRAFCLALLTVNWMRGFQLSRLIADRIAKCPNDALATSIRKTMQDIEEYSRFWIPKYLGCYLDLLRYHFKLINRTDLICKIQDLSLHLEFGVSQQTHLSLMGLGLSRTTTIYLSSFIMDDSLTEKQCWEWLRNNNTWMSADMPEIVKREIHSLL